MSQSSYRKNQQWWRPTAWWGPSATQRRPSSPAASRSPPDSHQPLQDSYQRDPAPSRSPDSYQRAPTPSATPRCPSSPDSYRRDPALLVTPRCPSSQTPTGGTQYRWPSAFRQDTMFNNSQLAYFYVPYTPVAVRRQKELKTCISHMYWTVTSL